MCETILAITIPRRAGASFRVLRTAVLLSCALTAGHGRAADAQNSAAAPLPDVTVIAPKPPAAQELAGKAVPDFVAAHTTPSRVIHQLTRWRARICPLTRGLDGGMNAFVSARIQAVATAVGAPHDESPGCKPNIQILFTLEPQQVLNAIMKQDSQLLGFHYPQQEKQLTTVTRPIQGWYVTSTRNYKGVEAVDSPEPLAVPDGLGNPLNASKLPPGLPGSRLTDLRTSQVVLALIVVDADKIKGMTIGSLSDYLAMLALSQAKSPDTCSQLPSIMDLMATHCTGGEKPTQITAGDLAFLKALYRANLETPIEIEEADIENAMMREFRRE